MDELKRELLESNQRLIADTLPRLSQVNWKKGKPSANDLVLIAETHKLLLAEAWLKEIEMRFQLERMVEITGLSEHELMLYTEIGSWISLDRHLEALDDEGRENFWKTMSSLDEIMENEDVIGQAREAKKHRDDEIAELNKLLGFDS